LGRDKHPELHFEGSECAQSHGTEGVTICVTSHSIADEQRAMQPTDGTRYVTTITKRGLERGLRLGGSTGAAKRREEVMKHHDPKHPNVDAFKDQPTSIWRLSAIAPELESAPKEETVEPVQSARVLLPRPTGARKDS
jgi:hypothetical protein